MDTQLMSDLVARRVVELRRKAGLTRDQLARLCQELGADDLTAAALANIETGRRPSEDSPRRRKITVDELLVLALALHVPPLWLLIDPADSAARVPVVTGVTLDSWQAALWFSGQEQFTDPNGDATPVQTFADAWLAANRALSLTYQIAAAIVAWRTAHWHRLIEVKAGAPDAVAQVEVAEEQERRRIQLVSYLLDKFQDYGYAMPLPKDLLDRAEKLNVSLPSCRDGRQ